MPGLDGRKMSKSYGNAVFLSDPPKEIDRKISRMMTDPARVKRTDPGEPEKCPAFQLHKIYCTPEEIEQVYPRLPHGVVSVAWSARRS